VHRFYIGVVIVLIGITLVFSALAQDVQYKVIPVYSPLGPSDVVFGLSMNNGGALALTDYGQNGQQEQAFEWKSNKGLVLTLLGGQCSSAAGINEAGHIVGGACPPGETLPHAYLYRKSGTLDLGTFGGIAAGGVGINRHDEVAGSYMLSDGTYNGFFWQRKGWSDLGSLGGSFTYAYDLNDSSVVTGQSDISNIPDPTFGIPPFHGYQWSGGVLTDFGAIFGSNFNDGSSINDAGAIAGSADVAGDTGANAIVWNNGVVQNLSPYGNITVWGSGINSQGDVIGSWGSVDPDPSDGPPVSVMLCPCYAVLWQNGQPTFLNDVVPPSWNLMLGVAINDRGEILAQAQLENGLLQMVLLKPLVGAAERSLATANMPPRSGRESKGNGPRMIRREQGGFREIY
jgi:probable HAF family extracellular repeat protein